MRFIYTKGFAVFFSALALVAALNFLHYKGWLTGIERALLQMPRPVVFVVRKTVDPIRAFFGSICRLKEIAKENVRLRDRVFDLQNRQAQYDAYVQENEQLKKELNFIKTTKLILSACAIIGRSPVGYSNSVVLDCGTEKGAEVGRAIISRGFLVGKITFAVDSYSIAQLITSADFLTDSRISVSGRLAVVKGSFNSGILLEQVAQEEVLEKGMLVVTAGVSEKVPKNLLIGEVGKVISESGELYKKASLISPIDLRALEFVFLVK